MLLKIPQYQAVKYMVYEDGEKLRDFYSKREATEFTRYSPERTIVKLEPKYKVIEVEEAPF